MEKPGIAMSYILLCGTRRHSDVTCCLKDMFEASLVDLYVLDLALDKKNDLFFSSIIMKQHRNAAVLQERKKNGE